MKKNQLKAPFSVLILTIFIFFTACKKDVVFYDGNIKNSIYSASDVNTWIYETMNHYYYWSDSMPLKANTNLNLAPMDYFYTLLYQYDVVDRFSWIDSSAVNLSNQLNGINTALGIKVVPFTIPTSSTDLVFVIGYVLKNSPAEKAGLKRGAIIMQVNGQAITYTNYGTILQGQTLTLGLGEIKNSTFSLIANSNLTITKAVIQTNPILVDTVLDYASKKVGYLAYTQFLSDYNNALRDAFGRYKAKQINELVIDLRYNGGGYVSASDVLSTLIVKDLSTHIGGVLNTKRYNSIYGAELKKTGTESDSITRFVSEANNIGTQLNRVFILTSGNTASASELVINNLSPFISVVLIGENTYGKNVGSFTITDSKNRWPYGLQPITFKVFNSKNESNYGTINGFTPNYYKEDNEVPYFQLGDQNETYLKMALNIISGAVAIKPNMIGGVPIKTFNKVQRLSISDNPQQDRIDMWMDSKNNPAQTF
jgi:C-terminal processing protease CtpA/Prc